MKIYLIVNSILYLVFAVWCLIKMTGSANFLGYGFLNNAGKVEYLTLYTGLQLGFAVFLGICAYNPNFSVAGLIFCVALYAGIILTRTISGLYFGDLDKATFMVGALEYSLTIWGTLILVQQLKK